MLIPINYDTDTINKATCLNLEWYKKSSKDDKIGYYDFHKNHRYKKRNMDVVEFRKKLTNYRMDTVEEAEKKPQKDGAAFRIRWLRGGNNYRRIVEPICIAEYYREDGQKDYKNEGRDKHFILLEKWHNEAEKEARPPTEEELNKKLEEKKKNVASILTLDSCFWAEVEEAILLCGLLKNEDRESWKEKFKEFEKYVMGLLEKYEVSSEIFFEKQLHAVVERLQGNNGKFLHFAAIQLHEGWQIQKLCRRQRNLV